jgi:type IV secretion system protein VirB11
LSTRALKHLLAPFSEAFAYPGTTEVVVNRCGRMMIEADGKWLAHDCPTLTYDALDSIAILAAFDTGQDVGPDKPLCITTLPGGERIRICRPPATLPGIISLTIRRPPSTTPSLPILAAGGLFEAVDSGRGIAPPTIDVPGLDPGLAMELAQAVLDRKNVLMAGATGSGKTTLLRALAGVIPVSERLITIEQSPELTGLPHENRVSLFYLREGKLRSEDLLEASLSMRPDRVLMQELTDGATFTYLRSVCAGHPGALATLHAGSAAGAFDALRLMVRQHKDGQTMPDADVRDMLRSHIDIIVHCVRIPRENKFRVSGVYRKGNAF